MLNHKGVCVCVCVCVASRDYDLVMFLYREPCPGWVPSVNGYLASELVDRSLDERMGG